MLRQDAHRQRAFSIPELVALIATEPSPEVGWLAEAFGAELETGVWEELLRGVFAAIHAQSRRQRSERSAATEAGVGTTGYKISRRGQE